MKHRTTAAHRKTTASGQVRIIGGRWRGRKLPVVDAQGLRPTTDRIKETVFNWLQFELAEAEIVDLFAGSGGLGFEALSRGAAQCHFVETWAPAVQQLRNNIQSVQANAQVHSKGALEFITSCATASIDVLFIDPPFGQAWLEKIIPAIETHQVLKPNAWIYVETGTADSATSWPPNWHIHREKTAGQVCYRLFQYRP